MDIFGEKKYEELDILTKLVEPINWSVADVLSKMPDEIVVDNDFILKEVSYNNRLYKKNTLHHYAGNMLNEIKSSYGKDTVMNIYEFNPSSDLKVNLLTGAVTGTVSLIKTKSCLTEDDLKEAMSTGARVVWSHSIHIKDDLAMERAREMLDIMGTPDALIAKSKRTEYTMCTAIDKAFHDILKHDRWRLRDVDLAEKLYRWIALYVENGNLAAMRNFCLLKAATHRGYPIYAIDEEPT